MSNAQPIHRDGARWAAVVGRDQAAASTFVYAVRTTGVYCTPGCASRRPRRANVRFFARAEDAERAGYRPCRRCRPDVAPGAPEHADVIRRACRALEDAHDDCTLADLAAAAGFSRWHFHRLFRAVTGVTPGQYRTAARFGRLEQGLARGDSVTAAVHAAGFGSSGRAYAVAGQRLGMRPGVHRRGGAGETIHYACGRCSLGWVLVGRTARGLSAIEFGDRRLALRASLRARFPGARLIAADPEFAATLARVVALVETPSAGLELPVDVQGTAFQQRVWQALRGIRPGETASYADVARAIGRPGAARAVARACAANPLAVVVPCHRVVRGDGELGGYRWGVERKRALLARERG